MDGRKRAVKVLVWRILSVIITLGVTIAMTGSFAKATSLTVILHAVLMIFHWFFECGWEKYVD